MVWVSDLFNRRHSLRPSQIQTETLPGLDFACGLRQGAARPMFRKGPVIRPRQLVARICLALISSLDGETRIHRASRQRPSPACAIGLAPWRSSFPFNGLARSGPAPERST